jgi:hypothetical protein
VIVGIVALAGDETLVFLAAHRGADSGRSHGGLPPEQSKVASRYFFIAVAPAAIASTSNRNSSLIVSFATIRTAVKGDSAELVIDSNDFLSSSAMCSATFGVVSQQPSHGRCFQALNASRPKIRRKHDLGGDNLAEGCGLLGYFLFQWRRHLVGNDSQLAQDRQALLDELARLPLGLALAHRGDFAAALKHLSRVEPGHVQQMLDQPRETVFSGFVLRARPKADALDAQLKSLGLQTWLNHIPHEHWKTPRFRVFAIGKDIFRAREILGEALPVKD